MNLPEDKQNSEFSYGRQFIYEMKETRILVYLNVGNPKTKTNLKRVQRDG